MQNPIKISVIMPVFNEKPAFLKKAIKSILNQSYSSFEFLIIDDGSSKKCLKILEDFQKKDPRIRLLKNPGNLGLAKTLNKALKEARGKFIARMDSDDLSSKERLKTQLEFMEKNSDCILCGSWAYLIDQDDRRIGEKKFYSDYPSIRKNILKFNFFTHTTWFFKKNVIWEAGGYSIDAPFNEDYDLLLRLAPQYRIENLPQFLCSYRLNFQSVSQKNNKLQEKYSLKVRLKAVREYGYPKTGYFELIKAFLAYRLLPPFAKNYLLQTSCSN